MGFASGDFRMFAKELRNAALMTVMLRCCKNLTTTEIAKNQEEKSLCSSHKIPEYSFYQFRVIPIMLLLDRLYSILIFIYILLCICMSI